MRLLKPVDSVIFIEEKSEKAYESLAENDWLKKAISKAIENLKQNAYAGEKISRKLWPKEYVKRYKVNNLYWYQLPKAWRLIYTIVANQVEILAVIVEYFDHKSYERRFKY
jgi:Txe/YoeB family toxin of Txe-Axe toxin-antitoxin module